MIQEDEIWLPHAASPLRHEVSNTGKIRSTKSGVPLKPQMSKQGYYFVSLYRCRKNGKGVYKNFTIHRSVATVFVANQENKPWVNHIDGNKLNNHYTNLEWCTPSENNKHSYKIGLSKVQKNGLGKFGKLHKSSKAVDQFDISGNLAASFGGISEASRITGYARSSISNACNRVGFKLHGYLFAFHKDTLYQSKEIAPQP